jgi:predicted RNA-binding protein YlxR (DUF448 family)
VSHEPRRTCVGCRQVRGKRELVRLVRRTDGTVFVDGRGDASGRGAYVCGAVDCVARLMKGGRLSQAFRGPSRAEPGLAAAIEARMDVGGESMLTSSGR